MEGDKIFFSPSAAPYSPTIQNLGRPVEVTIFGKKKAYVSCATLICSYIEALGGFLIGSEKETTH